MTNRSQFPNVERKLLENKNKRRRNKVVCALSVIVVISTVGILMRPAIALEGETYCGYEEHVHTDECYKIIPATKTEKDTSASKVKEDSGSGSKSSTVVVKQSHTHTDDCYTKENTLMCGKEETEGHTHTDDCYEITTQTQRVLICEDTSDEHEHTDDCYSEQETEGERVLTCEKEETEGHTHTDNCYFEELVLTCTESETTYETEVTTNTTVDENNDETNTTWETDSTEINETEFESETETTTEGERVLACDKEEHTHTLACYSNPDADVETDKDWEATLPSRDSFTGDVRHDTVEVAKSQLGYSESVKNYIVIDDDQKKGYTRYGAWYKDPYGDWNAMFASFCLYYGGATNVPTDTDYSAWMEALSDSDTARYRMASSDYEPQSGDLVFFDKDKDGTADWVGIAVEVTQKTIATIQGDVDDKVAKVTCSLNDDTIIGYGLLDDTGASDDDNIDKLNEKFQFTAKTESGITVTVSGSNSDLPYPDDEITMTVKDIDSDSVKELVEGALEEESLLAEITYQMDITLWHEDEEIEPTGTVTVTFGGLDMDEYELKIYHINSSTSITDMEVEIDNNGEAVVETDHFSTYVIVGASYNVSDGNDLHGKVTLTEMDGSYQVTDTAWTSNTITVTGDTILDLNGNALYYEGTGNLFVVQDGAKLTIVDYEEEQPSKTIAEGTRGYGNLATLSFDTDDNKVALSYYVTESNVSGNGIGTTETTYRYDVNARGVIVGTSEDGCASIVRVENGGELNLSSGLLAVMHSEKFSTDSQIIFNNGTLNITGGYVCGEKAVACGGGVYTTGTMRMSGGVIAANSGNQGGGVRVADGTFDMTGGVISGNQVATNGYYTCGGGIFVEYQGRLNLSGNAYVTNNSYNGESGSDGRHGGGGIASYQGTVNITGGYVTGNYSNEAGGGIYIGCYNSSTNFEMTAGTVAGNYCENGGGGGILISSGTCATINAVGGEKIYITNNKTNTSDNGGGGIFVHPNGTLNIYNSLIAKNTAQGLGGGIATSPTQTVWVAKYNGTAIYDNNAAGTEGYKDYYCVNRNDGSSEIITIVLGEMLGGGEANWTGMSDAKLVSIPSTGYQASQSFGGLTANPSDTAKQSAIANARVFITGNTSNANGGGIMSDGNLTLGDNSQIGTLHTPLVIEGRIGSSTSLTEVDLSQFKVLLLNNMPTLSSDGKSWSYGEEDIIGTATADINGAFTIESDKEYDSEGTYAYYLIEDTGTQVNVAYDKTMYTLSVDVKEYSDELGVSFNVFNVDNVAVAKSNSGLTTIISDDDLYTLSFNTLKFNDAIFTNEIVIPIYMRLSASDSITGDKLKGAQFNLYEVVDGIASDIVIASGVSDKEGNVEFHDPDDNNRIIQVKRNATYYLEEVAAPNGYVKAGPWIVNVDNEAKATLEEVIADTDDEYSSDTKRRAKARMTNVNEFESEETSMSITLYTDIPNSELSYQLPETGGIGTFQFTIGGTSIAVIAGLLLWYKNKKRRKEGFASM